MSFTVMTAAAPFIAVDLLGGTKGDVALLLGPFLVAAVPSFIFVPRMIARWGWERCTVTATVGLGLVYAGTGLLGDAILGTPITTAMILFTLGGPLAAVLLGLEGEAITASARDRPGENTAIYFGVYNFVVKGLNGVALYLTGLLAEEAREGAVVAVRIMGWTAGGLLVAGVFGYLAIRRRG
jgi:Na+/melibiose symporter-like transporter